MTHSGKQQRIEIGPNHKRGVTSTLLQLDKSLCDIERNVGGAVAKGVLYYEHNALSAGQKGRIIAEIAAIRTQLTQIRDALGLETTTREVGATIRGECMLHWESTLELLGKHLKRFGEPPVALVDFLDPKVADIVAHLDAIAACVGDTHGTKTVPSHERTHKTQKKE